MIKCVAKVISSNLSHRLPNKLNNHNPLPYMYEQLTILFSLKSYKTPKTSAGEGEGDSCLLKSFPADFRVNQSVAEHMLVEVLADDGAVRRGK